MAFPVDSKRKNAILYINGINTSEYEAKQHVKQITQSLSNIPQSFFSQYIYNPTSTNNYVNSNSSDQKRQGFSIETGINALIMASIKSDRVWVVTHSNGASQTAKILQKMNAIFDEDDPVRRKISVLNFGPDTLISNQTAKVASVQNFIFQKDRVSMVAQGINPWDNSQAQSTQNVIWLSDPKKIPKKKLSSSANPLDKLFRNLQYVADNAKNRHQFESYLPHITQALAQHILLSQ